MQTAMAANRMQANRMQPSPGGAPALSVLGWVLLPLAALWAIVAWGRVLVLGLWVVPKSLEATRDFALQTTSTLGKAAISISDWLGGRPGAVPGWLLVTPLLLVAFAVIGGVGWRRRWVGAGLAVGLGLAGWLLGEAMRYGTVDVLQEFLQAMNRSASQLAR